MGCVKERLKFTTTQAKPLSLNTAMNINVLLDTDFPFT